MKLKRLFHNSRRFAPTMSVLGYNQKRNARIVCLPTICRSIFLPGPHCLDQFRLILHKRIFVLTYYHYIVRFAITSHKFCEIPGWAISSFAISSFQSFFCVSTPSLLLTKLDTLRFHVSTSQSSVEPMVNEEKLTGRRGNHRGTVLGFLARLRRRG